MSYIINSTDPFVSIKLTEKGRQHFEIIDRWGGEAGLIDQQKKDEIKNKYCFENNIRLLRVSYKENIKNKLNENVCHI